MLHAIFRWSARSRLHNMARLARSFGSRNPPRENLFRPRPLSGDALALKTAWTIAGKESPGWQFAVTISRLSAPSSAGNPANS